MEKSAASTELSYSLDRGGMSWLTVEQQRCPFKLYEMLERSSNSEQGSIVSWSEDGRAFTIRNTAEFVEHVVPKYFKQTKYRSFVSVHLLLSITR